MKPLLLAFLIDGLVSIEQPFRDRFTLVVRLLIQLLPSVFFRQMPGDADLPAPDMDKDVLLAIQEEVETIIETFETRRSKAGVDEDAIRLCAEDASEALLQVIETYILTLIIPEDWRVVWMGVEG